jgi:hypothetical protein
VAPGRIHVLAGLVGGLVVLCVGLAATAAAADPSTFTVEINHTDQAPKVDGSIDDPVWQKGTHLELTWDYQFRRPASEKTDAYLLSDAHFIYVAIVAEQREPVTATLHTNDVPVGADDVVRVYLWPGGEHGFEYFFVSTPIGTHNEYSSENSAFTPAWTSVGKKTSTGYIITMRIPLNVMRGDGRASWRLQIERGITATGQDFVWAHDPAARGVDNSTYVGYLNGMTAAGSSSRIKPRIGLYTLGQIASSSAGGNTSHMGADIALPITETSSFFGTIHPDYSNVDLDQQTISPTAFQRVFREVRPFFTQGGNFYNNFNCNDCVDYPFLYTPAIPTPRDGFAVEGVQGLAQFAGFNSMAPFGRSDNAQTMTIQTRDKRVTTSILRFGTNCQTTVPFPCLPVESGGTGPAYHDDTLLYQVSVGNRHNSSVYWTGGNQHGTFVDDPSKSEFREYGFNLYTQKDGFYPAYHDIGPQYAPVDGFFQANDVHGPSLYVTKTFDFAPTAPIRNYILSQDVQHYRNSAGQLDLASAFSQLTINTRNQWQLQASSGYQYFLIGAYGSTINQNGVLLSYGPNTSAPSTVTYNIGRFGPGYLRTATRVVTLRTGARGTLTLEGDNTNQTLDTGVKEVQWLERASLAYPLSAQSSLAVGIRRIIGTSPQIAPFISPPQFNAANVSFAYYRHVGQDELYVVYGDPNVLTTLPAFIVKYVHYFGAQKGT